jgi:uncharacterized membrane protein YtjA (UPF0391 family)
VSEVASIALCFGLLRASIDCGGCQMLNNAILFFVIALIAGLLGFFAIAGIAATIAKVCFIIFLVLFVVSLITGRRSAV